jgi:DtxR family transcriptional regulator, Mn-dependent transcriptional regulator
MKITDGLELSPRKVEYLKFIYERGGTVKTNDIASRFRVDPSTITKTIAELAEAGYLSHVPYRGVVLTETGTRHVKFMIKRHRILSLILVRYGLTDNQACQEVSRFESFVSKDAIDRMCRAMGHPQQGICGKITHDEGCRHQENTAGYKNDQALSGSQETS